MNDKNTPIVGEDEMREFKAMVDDTGDLISNDISLDEIMMEFGAAPQKPMDVDPKANSVPNTSKTYTPVESNDELDEIMSEFSESPTDNKVSDTIMEDTVKLPHVSEIMEGIEKKTSEDIDVTEQISDRVRLAMSRKQQANDTPNIPKSVAQKSAVKVTQEYDAQDNEPVRRVSGRAKIDRENSMLEESFGYAISDDLKTFQKLMPEAAEKKAKSAVDYYRWRCIVTLILSAVATYITTAATYKWPLPGFISYINLPFIFLFLLAIIQIGSMLINISMIVDGLRNVPKFNFKSETLIAVFSFITLFHTISIIIFPKWGGYLPYAGVSILTLFFGSLARLMRYGAVRDAMRAICRKDCRYAVIKGMKDAAGKVRTVYKVAPAPLDKTIMTMVLEEDDSERVMRFYVPFVLVLGFIFAITASFGIGAAHRFLWCYSAVLAVSVPAGAVLAYVYPFKSVSSHLVSSGSVVAGNRGAKYLAQTDAAVVKDGDIFPTKMVAVVGTKTYSGFTPEKTNLYAMSMLKASGSGLYDVFCEYLHRMDGGNLPVVENFEFFENGGLGAYVNGEKVLLGSAGFIMRSGIRIPEGVNAKNSIFLAVNMQLAGHFTLKYDSQPSVRRALNYFVHRKVVPVIASRDFNITPSMVELKFKLSQDKFGYPELEERIAYSGLKDETEDEICAAIAVDNMNSYSDVVSGGKRVHAAFKVNMLLGWLSVILGMPIVFYLLFTNTPSSVTPFYLICYILLWFVPTIFTSKAANRR